MMGTVSWHYRYLPETIRSCLNMDMKDSFLTLDHLRVELLGNDKTYIAFLTIPRLWFGVDSWTRFLRTTQTRLSYIFDTTAADDTSIQRQGHQQPWLSQNYPTSAYQKLIYRTLFIMQRSVHSYEYNDMWFSISFHDSLHKYHQHILFGNDQNQRQSGSVFCLLLGVSSDYAQPITGQVTEVTCPMIGQAQPELTPSKRQKTGPDEEANLRGQRWCPRSDGVEVGFEQDQVHMETATFVLTVVM